MEAKAINNDDEDEDTTAETAQASRKRVRRT